MILRFVLALLFRGFISCMYQTTPSPALDVLRSTNIQRWGGSGLVHETIYGTVANLWVGKFYASA